jgi:predicted transcriptional regulator
MYTLIEIFDAKQYENIITPVYLNQVSKLIYIGSKEIMTAQKIKSLKRFFSQIKLNIPTEFLYVERDNAQSIKNRLTQIIKQNHNCIFDATGGEDVILTNVGVISERFSVPVIRIDTKTKNCVCVHGKAPLLAFKKKRLSVSDFITLEGGRILLYDTVSSFTEKDVDVIKKMFEINSSDCEAYSAFCNVITEFLSYDGKTITIIKEDFQKIIERSRFNITNILNLLTEKELIEKTNETENTVTYKINFPIVSLCLKKSGNALEYYTAVAASSFQALSDIRVGVNVEWDVSGKHYETQNEIDVMAISNGLPVFISCKNGEVRKEALYELDAVARAVGGTHTKKVLVCTYVSKNAGARDHIIKRARDMGIHLVFNAHKKSFNEFLRYLKTATV